MMRYVFNLQRLQAQGITVKPTADSVVFEDESHGFPIFHNDCFGDLRDVMGDEKAERIMERVATEINGEIFMAKLDKAKMPAY